MEKETVSIIGLGKLGLCMAACLADKGYHVIGVDIKQSVIEAVNRGQSPYYEPGLAEIIDRVQGNFTVTDDYKYAVANSKIIFIFVATPSDEDGSFTTRYVEAAAKEIALNLKNTDDYRLIVMRSTVLPGVAENVVKPLLEEISGKKCGRDFGLCNNPEFLALGSAINDFLNPDVVAIGESDPRSGELLAGVYQTVCQNQPPIIRTTLTNCEVAKISLNVFLTVKMSFANTIAEICEGIPGGDVDAISEILGKDRRIGRKFLTGAIGYGGPCFPRDTKAFSSFAQANGYQAELPRAAEAVNQQQAERVVRLARQKLGGLDDKTIAMLGLTYKPNTDITVESDVIKIASCLLEENARLQVYDPAGIGNSRQALGQKNVTYADSAIECLKDADLCLLTTPWDEFKSLTPEDFRQNMKHPVLLDCWRFLRQPAFIEKLDYLAVGLNSRDE